jgi:hypothetical protein
MTVFRITPEDSNVTDIILADAFSDDSAGADTLIVDAGAYLIASGL